MGNIIYIIFVKLKVINLYLNKKQVIIIYNNVWIWKQNERLRLKPSNKATEGLSTNKIITLKDTMEVVLLIFLKDII